MSRNKQILLATLTISGLLASSVPATGAERPEVVQIEDPAGDANFLNDQGQGGEDGDHVTPADFGSVSDLLAVWFSNDATNISAHIQTEAPPPATNGIMYRVRVNPDADGAACLYFEAYFPGVTNTLTDPIGTVRDLCTEGAEPIEATILIEDGPDETGITTITVPRSAHPSFAPGSTIAAPKAETRVQWFNYPGSPTLNFPQVDNTKVGTDYPVVEPAKKKKKKKKP